MRSAGSRWPAPKLPDLLLQLLDAPGPLGGGAGPLAGVDPGLADPAAQGLGIDPQLIADAPETPPGPIRIGQGTPSTSRIARRLSSSGYFLGAGMIPHPSMDSDPPPHPGRSNPQDAERLDPSGWTPIQRGHYEHTVILRPGR